MATFWVVDPVFQGKETEKMIEKSKVMADALQENRYPCIGPSKPKGEGK